MSTPRANALAVAVAAAVVAVLAAAVWAVTSGVAARPAPGPDQLAAPGGLVRVDEVVAAAPAMAGMAMPGMGTDTDPVPAGQRRVSVEVTVLAAGRGAMAVDPDSFTLDAGGARPPHRAQLPATTLPEGSQLTGVLVFDVPTDATTAVLGYAGGGTLAVDLPPETPHPAASAPDEDHGGRGSDPADDGHDDGGDHADG